MPQGIMLDRLSGKSSGVGGARAPQTRRGCFMHPGERLIAVAGPGHAVTITPHSARSQQILQGEIIAMFEVRPLHREAERTAFDEDDRPDNDECDGQDDVAPT